MSTPFRFVVLGAMSYAAIVHATSANAQTSGRVDPQQEALGSASVDSILRTNPVPVTPAAPRASEEPKIEGPGTQAQPESSDEPSIQVARIEVDGAPDYLKKPIDAVVAPYVDREMTLTELRNIAIQVTAVLLDNGESISYAYVPQQDVVDDVIHLTVMRGHVESVRLKENRSLVRDSVLRAYLERGLSASGDVKDMQDQLKRLADLPGLGKVTPTLAPGQTSGGTALSATAQAGPRVEGALVANNAGSRSVGRNQVGAQITVNSPLGLGDRLQAIGFTSPDYLQGNHDSDGGNRLVGRVSYDLPIGRRGARAGVAVQRVTFNAGGDNLDVTGSVTAYGLYGSYPILRDDARNLNVDASLDYFRRSDANGFDTTARNLRTLTLQVGGDMRGGIAGLPNVLQYQFGVTGGNFGTDDAWVRSRLGRNYVKTVQSLKLTQLVVPGVLFGLSANAQQTTRNLDGQEQMSLGGPNAVRAYDNSITGADSGFLASANLTVFVPKVKGVAVLVFYDRAQAQLTKFPRRASSKQRVALSGYGFGLSYTVDKRFSANLTHAIRIGSDPLLPKQHKTMTWFNSVVQF